MRIFGFLFFCLASTAAKLGLKRIAIGGYQLSARSCPKMADIPLYNLGNLYHEIGDLENAIRSLQAATHVDPFHVDAWINLGRALDEFGSHATAVNCYDAALEIDPGDVVGWSNRGNSLRALGNYIDAAKSYKRALNLDGADGAAHVGYAVCKARAGDKRGFQKVSQLYAQSQAPWILLERAKLWTAAGKYDRATADYEELLRVDGENHLVWMNRAKLFLKLGKAKDALHCYDRALELHNDYPASLFGKARLLAKLKRFEEAKPLIVRYKSKITESEKQNPSLQKLCAACGIQ